MAKKKQILEALGVEDLPIVTPEKTYIPTADVLDPVTGGGYESRLTVFTSTVPETADVVVKELSGLIAKETPGAVPTGPQVKPSNKVWDYGSNLPELE